MKIFAKVLLIFGMVMIVLSLLLRAENQTGSPEETVSTLNIFIGALMMLLAIGYLAYWKKKNSSPERQPNIMKAKGGQDSENTQSLTESADP